MGLWRWSVSVFSGDDFTHPLEKDGVDVIAPDRLLAEVGDEELSLRLKEDGVVEVYARLVELYGSDVQVDAVTLPSMGSLERRDGRLYYVPVADFYGVDSFVLSYSTPTSSGAISVTLEVESVNDAPQLADDFVSVASGAKRVKFSVDSQPGFLGDFDLEGQSLRVTDFSAPENGSLKKIGGNSFRYTPDPEFVGRDSFLYQVSDGEDYSVAEVTFTVGGDVLSRDAYGGFYELKSDGPDPIINPLRAQDGSILSDDSSAHWDIAAAVKDGGRYRLLLQGEGKKEGLYQVWTADESGQVIGRGKKWLTPDQFKQKTYGTIFPSVVGNGVGQLGSPVTDSDGGIFASIK